MHDFIDFPTKLKKLRMENGFSQESLSNAASLHHTYISMLECGKRKPSLVTIEKIANAFNMQTWEFIQLLQQNVIPRFKYYLSSPLNLKSGYITLGDDKVHHIDDVRNFYNALGYTDEILKSGLLPEEFIWFEYRRDNSNKLEICLQAKIIEYLLNHSSTFRNTYSEQYKNWVGSCLELALQKKLKCTDCLLHPKSIDNNL